MLEHVGKVAYQLALLASMDHIHNMFHLLLLCKYINDLTYVLRVEKVELKDDLEYESSEFNPK